MRARVTLSGAGGVLDVRVVEIEEGADDEKAIRDAVIDLALNDVLAIGDTIKIEEV